MFEGLKESCSVLDFLLILLVLLASLYLLLDVSREKLKESVPAVGKMVIPEKVALLPPLIFIILERLFANDIQPIVNEIA